MCNLTKLVADRTIAEKYLDQNQFAYRIGDTLQKIPPSAKHTSCMSPESWRQALAASRFGNRKSINSKPDTQTQKKVWSSAHRQASNDNPKRELRNE